MKKNQKGVIQIILIIGIVAALAVIGYALYLKNKPTLSTTGIYNPSAVPSAYQNQYTQSGQAVAPIQNSSDLNSAAASLNSTDTTQLDTQLKALDSASSGF